MKKTTLCYIRKNGKLLLLFRNRKEHDPNEGKWVGIGGKFEEGETAEECLLREVKEETGLLLTSFYFHGVISFRSDRWEPEDMYLFSSDGFEGEIAEDCPEGILRWIPEEEVLKLPMWEGDRYFLEPLIKGEKQIEMTLFYEGDALVGRR